MPGSFPITIPPPTVQYDMDLFWPNPQTLRSSGSAFEAGGSARYGSGGIAAFFSAAAGAGVNNMAQLATSLLPCGQFASDGVGGVVSRSLELLCQLPLVSPAVATSYLYPTWLRLFRWQFVARLQAAANVTTNTFMVLSPSSGAGVPTPDGNNAFFGITGDGAGNWQWQSQIVNGGGPIESVALGIVATVETVFDIVVLAATGAGPAVAQLYVNGVQKLARAWGAGSKLPVYTAAVNGEQFAPVVGARDAAVAAVLQIGAVRLMSGQFQVSGAQI